MSADTKLKAGEHVGPYRVLDPRGYCGVLPTAVIREGFANAGIRVILTSQERPT